jgi:hypothetical protein
MHGDRVGHPVGTVHVQAETARDSAVVVDGHLRRPALVGQRQLEEVVQAVGMGGRK